MSKTKFKISFILAILLIICSIFLFNFGKGLSSNMVITSVTEDPENKFYFNNQLAGDKNGFCFIWRNQEKLEVKLTNKGQIQNITFTRGIIGSKISNPDGDNLGLKVINANSNPELRDKFGCTYY